MIIGPVHHSQLMLIRFVFLDRKVIQIAILATSPGDIARKSFFIFKAKKVVCLLELKKKIDHLKHLTPKNTQLHDDPISEVSIILLPLEVP